MPGSSNVSDVHPLGKRDPSFVPADLAYQNCALINLKYAVSKSNQGIQMSECHVNSRIDNQIFAVFEPDDGDMLQPREYGPYGTCYAFSEWPLSTNLKQVANANYACFGWTKKSASNAQKPLPKFPGSAMKPPPLGCPSNLNPCYADHVYSPGGKLAAFANEISSFSGLMYGAKDANRNWLWCYGCKVGTNFQMQRENIGQLGCDTSQCAKYTGVTTLLSAADRSPLAQSAVQNTTGQTTPNFGVGGSVGSQSQSQSPGKGHNGQQLGTKQVQGGNSNAPAAGGQSPPASSSSQGGRDKSQSQRSEKQPPTQLSVTEAQNGGGNGGDGGETSQQNGQALSALGNQPLPRGHRRAMRRLSHV